MKLVRPVYSTPASFFTLGTTAVAIAIAALASSCSSKDADKEGTVGSDPGAGKTAQKPDTIDPSSVPRKDPPPPLAELPADSGAHTGAHAWSLRLGGTERDSARDIAFDAEGNAYVGGLIKGTVTIAGTEMKADDVDAVVVKLSPAGEPMWARHFGGPGPDMIEAIAVDASGSVIVAGSYGTSLLIGDAELRAVGSDDCFVAKFSADGKRLWAKRMGGIAEDDVGGLALDSSGNVYVSASFRDRVNLGEADFVSEGLDDAYLIALDGTGAYKWVARLASPGKDFARAVVTGDKGSVFWLAEFSETAKVGELELVSAGNRDWAVIELDGAGKPVWAQGFGGLADDVVFDLARDPAGDLLVTGGFSETMTVGAHALKSNGEADAFVAKLAHDGTPRWARSFGGKLADNGAAIATDSFGNVYAGGTFRGTVSFAGTAVTSAGKNLMKDVYLLKLAPSGDPLWARQYGGELDDYTRSIGVRADGAPVLVGTFYTKINFGGDDLVEDYGKAKLPSGEMFVVALGR